MVSDELYEYADTLLDELEFMPSREQQKEHLARTLQHLADETMLIVLEELPTILGFDDER